MKPKIAISMGDPGGVGPEVTLKALVRPDIQSMLKPVIYGDLAVLEENADNLNLDIIFHELKTEDSDSTDSGFQLSIPLERSGLGQNGAVVEVVQPYKAKERFAKGVVNAENGAASRAWIVAATKAVLANEADAVCTAPIAKEALFAAGFDFPGHTELLAHLCGKDTVRMMLVGGGLRVVLQTIHVALKDVPSLLTPTDIEKSLEIIAEFVDMTGQTNPRVAVCGLNPHAGESGHFGREELDVIAPTIRAASGRRVTAIGPLPADTVFHRALQGDFDFVLAMYHDQGLIPVKTLDFHGGVNTTLGLPLIRTSPDHGTAFNIAGKNLANESSMVAALKYAAELVNKKKQSQ